MILNMHVYYLGQFSFEAANLIKEQSTATVSSIVNQQELNYEEIMETVNDADTFIVISDRPCISYCKMMSDFCHQYGKAFIPIIVDQPFLTIGPVYINHNDSCYYCFIDRSMQHSPIPKVAKSIWSYYEQNKTPGPRGFHPSEPALLANWILSHQKKGWVDIRNQVYQLNLVTRETVQSHVIGIHGCHRCGLGRDEQTRGYEKLLAEIAWNGKGGVIIE